MVIVELDNENGEDMSNKNLVIDLKPRKDVDGRIFYVGKLKCPVTIDCSEGVAFLIFVSDVDGEQLQISAFDKNDD
jgi:hypothetical protein